MKNKIAVKCIYKYSYLDENDNLLDICSWEERIILLNAKSFEEADSVVEKYAQQYETSYINTDGQKIVVELYKIVDMFLTSDTNSKNNIEVYSNIFDASEEEVNCMLKTCYK